MATPDPSTGPLHDGGAHLTPVFASSWERLWAGLGARGHGVADRDDLLARYAEPWRGYHTLQHLAECLDGFGHASHLAARPAEVEAALWFHDAIHDPRAADNEERSALLAQSILSGAGVAAEAVSRIAALVRATTHRDMPSEQDARLLSDVDLSILGSAPARFAEYERQIRSEYAFVPEPAFRQRRCEILASFLARPRIYGTEYFFVRLEGRARANLGQATKGSAT